MEEQDDRIKKIGPSDPNLIVKSNTLMEGKFKFKLWEMRLFEMMISLIGREDTEFNRQRLYFSDLVHFFNSSENNDYRLIKEAAESLADKRIYINYVDDKGRKRTAKLAIFPTVTYPDMDDRDTYDSYVELEFHTDLKPHLLTLRSNFKSYDIRNISQMRSVYSIRMFILLKKYEKMSKKEFKLQELKDILLEDESTEGGASSYKLYADFKKRIILKPQEELLKFSDIRFEFVENRVGRRVDSITFYIYPNAPEDNKKLPQRIKALRPQQETHEPIILVEKEIPKASKSSKSGSRVEESRTVYQATNLPKSSQNASKSSQNTPKSSKNTSKMAQSASKVSKSTENVRKSDVDKNPQNSEPDLQDAADKLYLELEPKAVRQFGVSPRAFMELVDQNDEDSIRQAIRVTERALKEGKVKNIAGFFVEAVKRHFTDAEEEKLRRRQANEAKKQRAEALKMEGETLVAEKAMKVNDRIRQLLGEQPQATEDAIVQVGSEYSLMIETIAKQKGRVLNIEDYRQDEILRGLVIGTIVRMNRAYFEDILADYDKRIGAIQLEIKNILQ